MTTMYIYDIQQAISVYNDTFQLLENKPDLTVLLIYYLHNRHLVPLSPSYDFYYRVFVTHPVFSNYVSSCFSFFNALDAVIKMINTDMDKHRSLTLSGIRTTINDLYLFLE